MECLQTLQGHTGSVLCLQYDETVVVTGSSDSTIRLVRKEHSDYYWDMQGFI